MELSTKGMDARGLNISKCNEIDAVEVDALETELDNIGQYLRRIELCRDKVESFTKYPYCLPAVRSMNNLKLHPKVTFIVGENGSGKSTLLEAIATAYGFNPEGGTINFNFSTKDSHSELYKCIRIVRGMVKPKDGFFLRAESFYNVASNIEELDMEDSFGPPIIDSYGGVSLHEQSHGESFLSLFLNRFGGNGLYILDEPEAALSPSRQMTMLARLHELVKMNSQFIIATHSPIIMAYPDAIIYEIKEEFRETKYEETEHYQITRNFLGNSKKMLEILMGLRK